MEENKNNFFRFYKDGFDETRPMYENIIEAMAKVGALRKVKTEIVEKDGKQVEQAVRDDKGNIVYDKEYKVSTFKKIIARCEEFDNEPIYDKNGKMDENSIGLSGFLSRELGYTKGIVGKDDLHALYKQWGKAALGELPIEKLSPEEISKLTKEEKQQRRSILEARAFLAKLATSKFVPRTTMASAAHFMSLGRIMQIGCSQGKTSVVAFSTYEQLMMGEKIFSTSSAPGLVPENYDDAKEFYEILGVEEEFCSISRNAKTNEEHIVLFHRGENKEGKIKDPSEKYEIRESGKIYIERKEKDFEGKTIRVMYEIKEGSDGLYIENAEGEVLDIKAKSLQELASELGMEKDKDGKIDFKASVAKMMNDKNIIMGDTITLGKYKELIPKKVDKHLIMDEADAEMYDTQSQEILGEKYSVTEAEKRWEKRIQARDVIKNIIDKKGIDTITRNDLEGLSTDEMPLDFIVDAYEAAKITERNTATSEKGYEIKNGKIFVMNPNTNVMQPASQGLAQAILAKEKKYREKHKNIPEYEVLGETDISDLLGEFNDGLVSLMSGTMQDKGMQEGQDPDYLDKRKRFFSKCSNALALAVSEGVLDWKLVTPKTREEKGNVIVTTKGVDYNPQPDKKNGEKELTTKGEEEVADWRTYISENKDLLEKNWEKAVQAEAQRRSEAGQPVMVSIYGKRNPMKSNVPIYTSQNQKDSKEMAVDKKGFGEIACFDDFYGRGYTFKFLDKRTGKESENGGHVLITSLPQNSRNLEQFLFRVARGGNKGSSSIIISPTDPVLRKYLEKLEKAPLTEDGKDGKTQANEFFNKVISGELSVDEIVSTIYPEETKAIFNEKLHQFEMQDILSDYSKDMQSSISTIEKIGKGKETGLSEKLAKQYNKEVLRQMKLNRQMGTPGSLEEQCNLADKVEKNTLKEMVKQHKIQDVSELVALLPVGLTHKELEEIIPDDKLRYNVLTTMKKIEAYIERKNSIQERNENETELEKAETKRDTASETFRAGSQDMEYTLSETEKVLVEIRESKMNYRKKKEEQRRQEQSEMEMGG